MISEAEFALAYEQHFSLVRHVCAQYVGWDLAADLAQEAFCRVWEKRSYYQGRCAIQTWICLVARRLCINHLRAKGNQFMDDVADYAELLPQPGLTPEAAAMVRQQVEKAVRTFKALPARQKAMFGLRHFHGEQLGRIGREFGIHQSNVTRNIERACSAMRRAIRNTYHGDTEARRVNEAATAGCTK